MRSLVSEQNFARRIRQKVHAARTRTSLKKTLVSKAAMALLNNKLLITNISITMIDIKVSQSTSDSNPLII